MICKQGDWALVVLMSLLCAMPSTAVAQRQGAAAKPKTGAQPIEIRGTVPTPQVVTVRPRQIPEFSRAVLTPAFFDRQFWDVLLAPYFLVPAVPAVGVTAPHLVSAALPADAGHRPSPADTGSQAPSADPSAPTASTSRPAATDTTRPLTTNAPRE